MDTKDAGTAARVGAQVRRARKARGWTDKDLADAAGVAPGTIVRIENGRPVRPGNMTAVLNALDIPPISETPRTPDANVRLALDVVEAMLSAIPEERRNDAVHDLIRYMTQRQANGDL
jgi:transcriptional regulator with XRE-family HTH domain